MENNFNAGSRMMQNAPATAVETPTGVKIIAVLYYIGAAVGVIFSLLIFLLGSRIVSFLPAFLSGLVIVMGVIVLGSAVLSFFIGKGLWKRKRWARIVVIIFSILGVLGAVSTMVQGSILSGASTLIVYGLIAGYLLFSHKVKTAFS